MVSNISLAEKDKSSLLNPGKEVVGHYLFKILRNFPVQNNVILTKSIVFFLKSLSFYIKIRKICENHAPYDKLLWSTIFNKCDKISNW